MPKQRQSNNTNYLTPDTPAYRGLTESMTVYPDKDRVEGAPGMFLVESAAGDATYVVDLQTESCLCEDFQYRHRECKHLKRVRFWLGVEAPPAAILTRVPIADELVGRLSVTLPDGTVTNPWEA